MLSSISLSNGHVPSPMADQTASPRTANGPTSTTNPTKTAKDTPPSTSTASSSGTPSGVSVSISSAAKKALQEATETSTQTAQEASRGDLQAQHLLTKEKLAKQALQG